MLAAVHRVEIKTPDPVTSSATPLHPSVTSFRIVKHFLLPAALLTLTASAALAQTIVCPPDTPANVKLAAKEIRRYVYLRTGKLQPCPVKLKIDPSLGEEEYRISPDSITGGSDIGVLYGAYRYAELLGVRFYLHGDVVPDEKLKELPLVSDAGKPLFKLRGVNPWGWHPFGMDAWKPMIIRRSSPN